MRNTKKNTGRRSGEHDKEIAQQWVDLYWNASNSADERVCLNPDDAPEEHQFLYYCDPEPLLRAMQNFAKHGTFEFVDEVGISKLLLIHDYDTLLAKGKKPMQAVEELANKYGKERRSIQRWLQGHTAKSKKATEVEKVKEGE
jgi:hypothetical protein